MNRKIRGLICCIISELEGILITALLCDRSLQSIRGISVRSDVGWGLAGE